MWNRYTSATLMLLVVGSLIGCASSNPMVTTASVSTNGLDRDERSDLPMIERSARSIPKVSNSNAAAFDEAIVALQADDLVTAERLLRKVTASQPELAGPWINLGRVYALQGLLEDARLAFNRAIQANPDNCAAYNQLGVLSRKAGDFAGAEDHYQACIARVPDYQDVYLNLGILYELYLGRLDDALAAYRRYQSLSPEPDRTVKGWVMDLERRLGV